MTPAKRIPSFVGAMRDHAGDNDVPRPRVHWPLPDRRPPLPQILTVSADELIVPAPLLTERDSVDVSINGHRVWSIDLLSDPGAREGRWRWPSALQPYLDGRAEIDLADSVTGESIATETVRLGTQDAPIVVVDKSGRHLAVNKWGRLGKSFEGSEQGLRTRVLDRLDELVAFCEARDLRPFIVGGTLLGAVREGKILGHDDDADLAYLSHRTHPSDIALESFGIERDLTAIGIEVVRHSTAHLQLTWRNDDGSVDAYVDLFTAFFKPDDIINQPFHVRGPMARGSMLPFSEVILEGRSYPAPAVPEDWLVLNYDENWRTPLPGYVLRTPEPTRRRFMSWFGRFNFLRDYWEERHGETPIPERERDLRGADRLHSLIPPGAPVLDLGCGSGEAAVHLAELGHPTVAVDYSPAALQRATALARERGVEVDWRRLNLAEHRKTAVLSELIRETAEPRHVLISHLLERTGIHVRRTVLRLLQTYLRSGGRALVVLDTQMGPDFDPTDARTWHLEVGALKVELAGLDLTVVGVRPLRETPRDRARGTVTFEVVPTIPTQPARPHPSEEAAR